MLREANYPPAAVNVLDPAVLGAIGFVTAVLTVVAEWQTVRKNRREEQLRAAPQNRIAAGVIFEKIRVDKDNPYWREWIRSDSTAGTWRMRVESSNCKQFFHTHELVDGADPSIDVILRNDAKREATILAVGARMLRVAQYSYELPVAGMIEEVRKLSTSEAYCIEMPDILGQTLHLDFDGDDPPAEVNQLIQRNCEPYVLPPEGRFRYTLVLCRYANVPNNAILRLWVETNDGAWESHDVYLRYALSFGPTESGRRYAPKIDP